MYVLRVHISLFSLLCHRVKINKSHIFGMLFWTISFLWLPLLDQMFLWVKSMKNLAQWAFTLRRVKIKVLDFPNSELQETQSCILLTYVAITLTNCFKWHYFNLFLRLFYCIICLLFIFYDNHQVKYMADMCGWDSLTVKFKTDFLKPCCVRASPRKVISSVLRAFVWIPSLFNCI